MKRFNGYIAVLALVLAGSNLPAAPSVGKSASRVVGGTTYTWSFNCGGGDCRHGRFINGEIWVAAIDGAGNKVSAVTLIGSTPAGTQNGLEMNPNSPYKQGVKPCETTTYDANRNLMGKLPAAIKPPASLIKAEFRSYDCGTSSISGCCVNTYDVLTVLADGPENDGATVLRPCFSGTVKKLYTRDDFDLTRLPSLARMSADPKQASMQNIADTWSCPVYDAFVKAINGDRTRGFVPHGVLPDYGADVGQVYISHMLSVMGTESVAEKEKGVFALLQRGLDIYGMWQNGAIWGPGGAGQQVGRKEPLAFFAALVKDNEVLAKVRAAYPGPGNEGQADFQEDGQIRKWAHNPVPVWGDVDPSDCNEKRFWSNYLYKLQTGDRRKGNCGDPYGYIDGPAENPGGHYMVCCSTGPFIGYSFAMQMMPWLNYANNNPSILQYADRMMGYGQYKGVWTKPDPCAPPDPRESSSCNVWGGGTGCIYYGKTWGPDPNNPGDCIKHNGDPLSDGRWPENHGKIIIGDLGRFPSLAKNSWAVYRPCTDPDNAAYPCEGLGSLPPTTIIRPELNSTPVNRPILTGPNPMQDRFVVTLQDISTVTQVHCEIYSADGSRAASVKTLTGNLLIWDGADETGRQARPGVYFYSVEAGSRTLSGRILKTE